MTVVSNSGKPGNNPTAIKICLFFILSKKNSLFADLGVKILEI